ILILGLGGGTVARQCRLLFPAAKIVGVDIDKEIIDLAHRHFALAAVNLTVIHASGQQYLRSTKRKFDAIIDDMWLPAPFSPKPALTETAWPALIDSHLNAGGVYSLNLYSRAESAF